jgi:2-polyprenyl-3-methyl-5-hydroxy-6-metoxy-1,4-benzoquinol methylase
MSARRYDRVIDLGVDNAHTRVLRLVGEGKRVLELGCASGYMARVMTERFGCTVTGVERDPGAAREASRVCRRVVVADLDQDDWAAPLGEARFDVVVCADVLEHLRQPARILAELRARLVPDGCIVASVPNVAHAAVVAELLAGRFTYRPLGLLDETHLRFFTRQSVYECFERAGLVIVHLERVCLPAEATEFRTDLSALPPGVRELILAADESLTYQFVLKAVPAAASGTGEALAAAAALAAPGILDRTATGAGETAWGPLSREVLGESEDRHRRGEGLIAAVLGRIRTLEDERAEQTREVARLEADVRASQAAAAEAQRRVQDLHAELAALRSTLGWRLLERVRRVRGALVPAGGARERLYRRLVAAVGRRLP